MVNDPQVASKASCIVSGSTVMKGIRLALAVLSEMGGTPAFPAWSAAARMLYGER